MRIVQIHDDYMFVPSLCIAARKWCEGSSLVVQVASLTARDWFTVWRSNGSRGIGTYELNARLEDEADDALVRVRAEIEAKPQLTVER